MILEIGRVEVGFSFRADSQRHTLRSVKANLMNMRHGDTSLDERSLYACNSSGEHWPIEVASIPRRHGFNTVHVFVTAIPVEIIRFQSTVGHLRRV